MSFFQPIRTADGVPILLPPNWIAARRVLRSFSDAEASQFPDASTQNLIRAARRNEPHPPPEFRYVAKDDGMASDGLKGILALPEDQIRAIMADPARAIREHGLTPTEAHGISDLIPVEDEDPRRQNDRISDWIDVAHARADRRKPIIHAPPPPEPIADPAPSTDTTLADLISNAQASAPPPETPKNSSPPVGTPSPEGGFSTALDALQNVADIAGTFEPTPFIDGINAAVSMARAKADPENAKAHQANAMISLVSMIPYIGDLAKAGRIGTQAMKTGRNGAKAAPTGTPTAGGHSSAHAGGGATGGGGAAGRGTGGPGGGGGGGTPFPPPMPGGGPGGGNSPGAGGAQQASGMAGMLQSLTNLMGGPIGTMTSSFISVARSAMGLVLQLDEGSRGILEYNRNLSQYNTQLSAAYGMLDADRQRREIERATALAPQLSGMAGAQSDLEQALQDFGEPFEQLRLAVVGRLVEFAANSITIIDQLEGVTEVLGDIAKLIGIEAKKIESRGAFADYAERMFEDAPPIERKVGR